ncbi:O-acetyl-ADP-ribose deacetylase [Methylacidimicrobium tartarophylax]|uniref:O-acetyl-ADP-ribose deacetylase n=1 Tax=Methylacidimicrobium tartarophylax TaxID=1041768 RepID=UPI0011596A03|nr:O-acetyl-ADP-ribose deacetylase [Methylacidimicrobium tartarophylax]
MERVEILFGDITRLPVDAVVNAANVSLLGGGGVDGALHRAAGPELLEECRALGGCPVGKAKVTKGYRLPAKWVIHVVGPFWQGGEQGEDALLAGCYREALGLAAALPARSVAFPAISTGAYRFPADRAAVIALREIAAFLSGNLLPEKVFLVCFRDETLVACRRAFAVLGADR